MIELIGAFVIVGIFAFPVLTAALGLALIGILWGSVWAAENCRMPRMPRMRSGSWCAAPGFALRLVVLFCATCCLALLLA